MVRGDQRFFRLKISHLGWASGRRDRCAKKRVASLRLSCLGFLQAYAKMRLHV